jgi:hypothetical protein
MIHTIMSWKTKDTYTTQRSASSSVTVTVSVYVGAEEPQRGEVGHLISASRVFIEGRDEESGNELVEFGGNGGDGNNEELVERW